MKTLRRLNSVDREQPREYDEVAEDEDPESVGDDDARRRRPAAATPARELAGNRVDRSHRHAGRPRPSRARSIRAISLAGISRSRFSLQPKTRTVTRMARRPRIANHEMYQIAEKPATTAKKAMTKPMGVLRGISIV